MTPFAVGEPNVLVREGVRLFLGRDMRSPQQLQKRVEMGDFFIREILQKGRILYESDCESVGS